MPINTKFTDELFSANINTYKRKGIISEQNNLIDLKRMEGNMWFLFFWSFMFTKYHFNNIPLLQCQMEKAITNKPITIVTISTTYLPTKVQKML